MDLKFSVHMNSLILINFLIITFGRGVGEREEEGEGKEFRPKEHRPYFSIFLVTTGVYSQGQNMASPAEEEQNTCSAFYKRELPKSHSHLYSGWRYASLNIKMLQQVS